MSEVYLEAFIKVRDNATTQSSFLTALVKNSEASRAVTSADALSVELTVHPFTEDVEEGVTDDTQLQFLRNIDALNPGNSWDYTWEIQGAVFSASLVVRDSAGANLASASAGNP